MTPGDRLQELFRSFDRSAWRWECQGEYAVDVRALERWRAGLPDDPGRKGPWLEYVRDVTGRGLRFERVRMLTEPLTEYLRWMLTQTRSNVEAGEDIRWLTQSAVPAMMPAYDFYLLDDERVAIMGFGEDKLLVDLEVTDEPEIVERHRSYRDAVWPLAIKHTDYLSRSA